MPERTDSPPSVGPTPAVVLVRPQFQGNVGSAARAMANMGLERLILVEPAVELGGEARALGVGAGHILDAVERVDSLAQALAPFDRAVGTSSGRKRQLEQRILTARELGEFLDHDPAQRVALVFGPEASGLNRDEIAMLDPLVTIPCSTRQPTLNLAQAVLLVAYELQLATHATEPTEGAEPGSIGEVEQLLNHIEALLQGVGFHRDDTYRGVVRDLRQMAARSGPSRREIQILHGICRRALHALRLTGNAAPDDQGEE